MNVADIMSVFPAAIEARRSAHEALDTARLLGIHQLLVVDQGELIGVVCCCELSLANADDTLSSCTKTVAVTIDATESIERAARIVISSRIGCLPVIATDGKLAGIVTRRDLRLAGALDEDLDCCACCGSRHDLHPLSCPDALVICRTCEQRDYLNQRLSYLPETLVAKSA
jgi:CBS-domain-containing membrane protein